MFLKYNFPGIAWGVLILILLGLPSNDFPDTSFLNIPHKDKIIHFGLFLIFVFLLSRGFALQYSFALFNKYPLVMAFTIGILYGGITELLQESVFISRGSDLFDFLSDVAGCFFGFVLFLFFKEKALSIKKNGQD